MVLLQVFIRSADDLPQLFWCVVGNNGGFVCGGHRINITAAVTGHERKTLVSVTA